jgi:hypothetical protein
MPSSTGPVRNPAPGLLHIAGVAVKFIETVLHGLLLAFPKSLGGVRLCHPDSNMNHAVFCSTRSVPLGICTVAADACMQVGFRGQQAW